MKSLVIAKFKNAQVAFPKEKLFFTSSLRSVYRFQFKLKELNKLQENCYECYVRLEDPKTENSRSCKA